MWWMWRLLLPAELINWLVGFFPEEGGLKCFLDLLVLLGVWGRSSLQQNCITIQLNCVLNYISREAHFLCDYFRSFERPAKFKNACTDLCFPKTQIICNFVPKTKPYWHCLGTLSSDSEPLNKILILFPNPCQIVVIVCHLFLSCAPRRVGTHALPLPNQGRAVSSHCKVIRRWAKQQGSSAGSRV